MGTSGNPAKKAATKKAAAKKTTSTTASTPPLAVSSVKDFKRQKEGVLKELPSGLVVRVKKVELQTYIKQGEIPNALLSIVSETLEKGKATDIEKAILDGDQLNLDRLNEMFEMVNSLVMGMIIEPQVHPVPTDEDLSVWNSAHDEQLETSDELRDDDLLYVDELAEEDKMFLFQWSLGGTDDLATFRLEAGASLDALAEMSSSVKSA